MERIFNIVNEKVVYTKCMGDGLYIKFPEISDHEISSTQNEFDSYLKIRNFLNTPQIRLIDYRGFDCLTVKKFAGPTLHELYVSHDCERTLVAIDGLFGDVFRMWGNTRRPMDEASLSRNSRLQALSTISRIQN